MKNTSSFKGIPKLEHRIRLPEMLIVINKPYVERMDSTSWEGREGVVRTYYRTEPPPRYVFEEERTKATIYFSSNESEFVGQGHWSNVFRVRMEHPDFTCQLKKKKVKDAIDVDAVCLVLSTKAGAEMNSIASGDYRC